MRFNWTKPRTFDLQFPDREDFPDAKDFPEEEVVTLKCRMLNDKIKTKIEDGAFTMSGAGSEASEDDGPLGPNKMTYNLGTIRRLVIRNSIEGWENVLDEEDGEPTKFSNSRLATFVAGNGGFDPKWGSFQESLFTRLSERNGLSQTEVDVDEDDGEKNS